MSASSHPSASAADADESLDTPPVPDEDGPHDVPDDQVIEKTLPAVPVPDSPIR